jgi:hypothetical protein
MGLSTRKSLNKYALTTLILSSVIGLTHMGANAAEEVNQTVDKNDKDKTFIELIADGKSVEIRRGESIITAKRGEAIKAGDTIVTGKCTVYIRLPNYNELQIAPGSTLQFEEFNTGKDGRTIAVLREGIVWGLIVNEVSLANPFYLRTPELTVAVPSSNFVVEVSPIKKTSVLSLEGYLKYARNMTEISSTKKSYFLNSNFRVHATPDKIGTPKKFKRNVLISYLNRKAKTTAKDIVTRGSGALGLVAKKGRAKLADDEITWYVTGGTAHGVPNGVGAAEESVPRAPSTGNNINMTGPSVNSFGTQPINL